MPLENGKYLFLHHALCLRREERFLATFEYRYWYQASDSEDSWITRYEYVREPETPYPYPRCHLHVNAEPALYHGGKPFPELHLPAGGRVTIEDIARHLIVEHDVPPVSTNWEQVLDEAERHFREIQSKRFSSAEVP